MQNLFDIPFDRLPDTLPIFPLAGVLLLPRGNLSLNIFEQRYLNMVMDALAADRLIGMIQPDLPSGENTISPTLFKTGCAGRISSFMEADNNRLLITLSGVCRFDVQEEVSCDRGYRRVIADWNRWEHDAGDEAEQEIDRDKLTASLRQYFAHHNITVDWNAIEKMPHASLVTFLSMNLPFEPSDKQLLLEAATTLERSRLLIALTDIASSSPGTPDMTQH